MKKEEKYRKKNIENSKKNDKGNILIKCENTSKYSQKQENLRLDKTL